MPVRRISEDELRAAARASVRNHHAVTAVLFGSRARGTASALSDWDVCMITDGDHHVDAAVRRKRLEADHGLWGHPKIEIVWLDRSVFDTSVPIGSLQANIVRDGRVLAGDTTMARARVAPFEAAAVQRNIGRAGNRLHQAIVAAGLTGGNTRGVLPEEERIDMIGDSIAGAEALGRGHRSKSYDSSLHVRAAASRGARCSGSGGAVMQGAAAPAGYASAGEGG